MPVTGRILIVDDEEYNRKILRILLESLNFIVCEATCGMDVLHLIEESSFDLILLDVMMPDVSGIEICRNLTKTNSIHTPIIFLSAKVEKKDILRGLQVGAYDYLTKPFDIDVLEEKVNTAIAFSSKLKELQKNNYYLQIMASTDELTGFYNRSYLKEVIEGINRGTNSFRSVMMVDIDSFKEINDNNGHLFGDSVLKRVSQIILDNIDLDKDVAFRYGGDEFLVLVSDEAENCKYTARSICDAVSSILLKSSPEQVSITVSIGVSAINEIKVFEDIILKVDKALYAAKRSGRNCFVIIG